MSVSTKDGVTSVTTPSGIVVEYESQPKRLYRVNGAEVPSVTTALDCLSKPALTWWGMKIGVAGVQTLISKRLIHHGVMGPTSGSQPCLIENDYGSDGHIYTVVSDDRIIELLTQYKLTVNHVRDAAGERGVTVHDALEKWAMGGVINLDDYEGEEQGYVRGLLAFLEDSEIEPLACEVMVGSDEYGYAGRFDLRCASTNLMPTRAVVTKLFPVKAPKMDALPVGEGILDLKTSKGVYGSHFLQLEAYEHASKECGYAPTDWRAVLRVTPDGKYEFRQVKDVNINDFLSVLQTYKAVARAEKAVK